MTPEKQTAAYLKCQDAIERLENENMAMREAIKEAHDTFEELKAAYIQMCTNLQICVHKHCIGLVGEKLDRLVCDHIEAQDAQITAMREAIKEASLQVSAFLGFYSDSLSLPQMRSLSECINKLQPFLTEPKQHEQTKH